MNPIEIGNKLQAKREELAKMFTDHTVTAADGSVTYDFTGDELVEVNNRNAELMDLGKQYDAALAVKSADDQNRKELDRIKQVRRPSFDGAPDGADPDRKSLQRASFGDLFIKGMYEGEGSDRRYIKGRAVMLDFDMKTLFERTAGWDPFWARGDRLVLTAERELMVSDLFPKGGSDTDTIGWMEETTKTSGAAETTEGSAYAESTLALTERTAQYSKIATFIPVTEEQMTDERRVQDYLQNRLNRFVLERLDSQLLVGDGIAPNLKGVLNESIQSQALGTDDIMSAVFKAITKVRYTGFAEPDALVFHPNDWEAVVIQKDADGRFIWGNPSDNPVPRMWGKKVVTTTAETENTALVGAFMMHTELVIRSGVEVEISNSHDDYFVKGKLAIRARMRAFKPMYRATAFCKVTGI